MDKDLKKKFDADAKKLGYLYGFAKSKSAKKRLSDDLCKFQVLYEDIIGEDKVFKWSEDESIVTQLYKNREEDFFAFVNNYLVNYDFYKKSSNVVLNSYKDIDYNFLYKNVLCKKFSYDEADLILRDFFSKIGNKYYDFYLKLINDDKIYMNYPDKDYAGLTYSIDSIQKSYAVCSSSVMSLGSMSTIVHEIGHCYENYLQYNNFSNSSSFDGILYEVSSCFFELLFIKYLCNERIFLNDALVLNDDYYKNLYYYMFEIGVVCDFKEFNCDFYTRLKDDKDLIDAKIVKFNNKYYGDNRYYDKSGDINVRDSMIYGYGMFSSILMYEKFLQDKNTFLKGLDNIFMTYPLINDFSVFENVGISKMDFSDKGLLKKVLSKHKSDINK